MQELFLLGLSSDAGFVEIKFRGHNLLLKGDEAPFLTSEIFFDEAYKQTNPNGKDVVDIGANIGDSALYFALRGAKHVYGFEPYPYVYKTALENIRINGLEEKITMLNSAIGGKEGTIIINPETQSFIGSDLKASANGAKVSIITLENTVNKLKIKDGLLKIDCEGGEYQIILSAPNEILRNFNEIIIEYHYGYLDLKNKLECAGFSVKMLGFPFRRYNPHSSNSNMTVGILHAKRKTSGINS
ncbi:FkbM family methyltransferase [Candidatus Micrarchaeota archaeon]|nr:FkbM family methyltransferase [Candidatus Micrarchaeota archaeon]MBU1681398.1 FkbM family methyltransferase [Candidatus Micrarchaeota archaeon]